MTISKLARPFAKPTGYIGLISTFMMSHLTHRERSFIVDMIDYSKPPSVLEVGFGNGSLLAQLMNSTFLSCMLISLVYLFIEREI